jgi:predicted phage terminase large subunit-like protein
MPGFTRAQLTASLCRESFQDFVREFWDTVVPEPLVWNWHIGVMCDELQTIAERIFIRAPKEYDEVANVPPGTSKSTVASVMFPAWAWTRMPSFCFIGASYAHPLALDLSRRNRDVVTSELYRACFPDIILRNDQNTKGYFANSKGGYRYAVGSNGSVTGMHGHVIGIDDPLDPNRAVSEAELYQTNDWIRTTLSTRKKDKRVSVMFLVMQRLHQDDPTALFLARRRVRHVCLPGSTEFEVKPPALKGRYVDGLLDPARLPRDALDEIRQELGEYGYAGQIGQSPVPAGGGKFKTDRLRWGPRPAVFKRLVRFWDKAATGVTPGRRKKSRAAYTVGPLLGLDPQDRVWVLDVVRGRWDSAERERVIRRTAFRDGKRVVVGIEQEPGSGGKDSAVGTVSRLQGWKVVVLPARGSKELRADEFSVQVNNGNVWLPESFRTESGWAGWAKDYVDELRHWPFSTYKDQGDASGGAYTVLVVKRRRVGPVRHRRQKRIDGAVAVG